MDETTYLFSTPGNKKRLLESIAQDKAGNAIASDTGLLTTKRTRPAKPTKKSEPL